MSIKVEVTTGTVETRTITGKQSGKPFTFREQEGYAYLPGEKYPRKIRIKLADNHPGYAPGYYVVSDDSYTVGDYGDLKILNLVLQPITNQAKAA